MAITKKAIKANRKKWIAALRSGKYKQGRGILYNKKNNTFCCLGVAAIVCGVKLDELKSKYSGHLSTHYKPIAIKLGLKYRKEAELIFRNDDGVSFNTIANDIESWNDLD